MFYLSFYPIFLPVISIESSTDLLYSSIYLPDIIIYGTCSVYLTVLSIYLFLSFSSSIYFLYLFYVSTFYIYLLYLSSPSICQLIFYLPDLLHSDKKMSSQIPISPGRTEIMINFYFLAKMRTYTYISNIFPCIYKYSMMILITLPSPLRFIIPSAHLLVIFLSTPFTPQILQYHTVTLPAISVFFKRDT